MLQGKTVVWAFEVTQAKASRFTARRVDPHVSTYMDLSRIKAGCWGGRGGGGRRHTEVQFGTPATVLCVLWDTDYTFRPLQNPPTSPAVSALECALVLPHLQGILLQLNNSWPHSTCSALWTCSNLPWIERSASDAFKSPAASPHIWTQIVLWFQRRLRLAAPAFWGSGTVGQLTKPPWLNRHASSSSPVGENVLTHRHNISEDTWVM